MCNTHIVLPSTGLAYGVSTFISGFERTTSTNQAPSQEAMAQSLWASQVPRIASKPAFESARVLNSSLNLMPERPSASRVFNS